MATSDCAVMGVEAATQKLFCRERRFVDRCNPLEVFSEQEVREKFRLWPQTILALCAMFNNILGPETNRSMSLPTLLRVCCGLRLLASGGYNHIVGDLRPIFVDRATVYRHSTNFVDALCSIMSDWITFKHRDDPGFVDSKTGFYNLHGNLLVVTYLATFTTI